MQTHTRKPGHGNRGRRVHTGAYTRTTGACTAHAYAQATWGGGGGGGGGGNAASVVNGVL
jgi:hypothetical protein